MLLPQRPYFPVATLSAAVAYPAEPGTYNDAKIAEALAAVGLPELVARLDEEAHWNRMLSQGEQQRARDRARASGGARLSVPRRSDGALDEASEAPCTVCCKTG